jgi:beta-mannanase
VALYEQLKVNFQEELSEDNDIRNVTLLNADINRGYGNITFMQKRKTIIEREGNGLFIPLCTKNVFLKYYYNPEQSENRNWLRWSEQDREDYINSMQNIIETFLSGGMA